MKAISFDAISIEAILAGKKTMTRRPMHITPETEFSYGSRNRWKVGDTAYVKTGWVAEAGKKHPAMFMPKVNSPFSIRITGHSIQHLRVICAQDVEREGIDVVNHLPLCPDILTIDQLIGMVASRLFQERWNGIYGKRPPYRWKDNPLVECLTFIVIDNPMARG